jgi:hypothetical protein
MNCGQGVSQTHNTCWFYTILNGLLLSEGGQKLLYEKMIHFYKGLTTQEKTFFKDGIDAPCPRGTNFKQIYFYKFLDQYFCFMSGPRSIKVKAGLSPKLLNNRINLNAGNNSFFQFVPLLRRLGFEENEYQVINNYEKYDKFYEDFDSLKTKIIMSKYHERPTSIRGYELMCSCINLRQTHAKKGIGHAIAGYVCNGHPYLIDSNFLEPIPCKWWDYKQMIPTFKKINAMYNNIFENSYISYSVYVRRSSLRRIHPACLLRYKKQKSTFFSFSRKKAPSSPSVLPVPNSKSPIRTRSRGIGKPRKKVI